MYDELGVDRILLTDVRAGKRTVASDRCVKHTGDLTTQIRTLVPVHLNADSPGVVIEWIAEVAVEI